MPAPTVPCPICDDTFAPSLAASVGGIETPDWCSSCRASFCRHPDASLDPEAAARWGVRRAKQAQEARNVLARKG